MLFAIVNSLSEQVRVVMVELDRQSGNVSLTQRGRDILRLLANGLTDSEIPEAFTLTVSTVKWYNQ